MFHYERNAHGGFTPTAVARTSTVRSFIVPVLCIVYPDKRNSPEPLPCTSIFFVIEEILRYKNSVAINPEGELKIDMKIKISKNMSTG